MSEKQTSMNNTEENKTQPTNTFRAGNLSVTQWDNTIQKTDGTTFEVSNYTIKRGYQDKEGVWHSTDQLQHNDLPKVAMLLEEAFKARYEKE